MSAKPTVDHVKVERELRETIEDLTVALRGLVNAYIANENTEHEFVSCITPRGIPKYWRDARRVLYEAERKYAE